MSSAISMLIEIQRLITLVSLPKKSSARLNYWSQLICISIRYRAPTPIPVDGNQIETKRENLPRICDPTKGQGATLSTRR